MTRLLGFPARKSTKNEKSTDKDRRNHSNTFYLHGACIGAGIELPAFAERIIATPDTVFRLPEVEMGLIPGAGGCVSITKRIGNQRTNWLAISGTELSAEQALAWGLIDAIAD